MNPPDTSRVVETFIPIPVDTTKAPLIIWHDYMDLLRCGVLPLVRRLQERGLISWFSFLIHSRESGVPTTPDDDRVFVHLRFELAASKEQSDLCAELPPDCVLTRPMPGPHPHAMAGIQVDALHGGSIAEAWRVLGETSEWVLGVLAASAEDKPVSMQNVCQFLHFFGNSLMANVVRIPMP